MKRTTIMLPEDLQTRAAERGYDEGLSFAGVVREALETYLGATAEMRARADGTPAADPFFADRSVYRGKTPIDTAKNHDRYLYGDGRRTRRSVLTPIAPGSPGLGV